MSKRLLIIGFGVACFIAGYGVAVLLSSYGEAKQSLQLVEEVVATDANKISSSSASAARNTTEVSQASEISPTIIHVIKEVSPAASYSNEQQGILDSLKEKFVKEGLGLLVDSIDVADLVALVARVSGYNEADLWTMQQPHNFAKKLLDLNFQECSTTTRVGDDDRDEEIDDGYTAIKGTKGVVFSLNPSNAIGDNLDGQVTAPVVYRNSFDQANASRIYANFKLPQDYAYRDVLVKWCKERPQQRNIVFGPHSINRGRELNYVWYAARQVELGDYHVQIYSSDEQPVILAKGSYSILPSNSNY